MVEKKLTVVIPTLQKCKNILVKLIDHLDKDDSVTEIIIIDNSLSGFNHSSPKVIVITPNENIYVNPAWNLGVKKAKNEIVALLNDDIILPENFCRDVIACMNKDMGIIGVNQFFIQELPQKYHLPEANTIILEKANYMDNYYGIAMFFYKSNYVPIPEEIKIVYGDSWIFTRCEKNKKSNYRINGATIYHYGSLSSGMKVFNPIAKQDSKIYKRLTVSFWDRLFSYENIWDCYKIRILGITLKIKK